ncbi:recombinase family protein [Geminocystis sp. GBBB08]|uniref:recombinase family protein n=1 Tax=Geminocystis sp. GBBB08 TaxID=2604140 RepID=UPI0027E35A49|nr:recombinase family protein [Geminocystis sp. GBBB08]
MIIAYTYTDPIIDKTPDAFNWGCEIEAVYQDIGNRKQLENLILDSNKNPPNYLLIRSLSEFGNSLAEATQVMAKIEILEIEIIAIEEDYNSSKFKIIKDSQTKEKLRIIWENLNKKYHSRNLQKSHSNNRLNTLPPPGKAPFGYLKGKDSYVINRATSPIIKDFFERFLLYSSVSDSVRYLEQKYNKKIALSTAINWLKNPVYRGDLAYKNKEIIADTHTPIISREEAAQIDRILKSHRLVKPRSTSANYALSGLVKCKICKSSYKITKVTNKQYPEKYLYLIPTQCQDSVRCKSIKYAQVFEEIINIICRDFPVLITNINAPDPQFIQNQLAQEIQDKEEILIKIKPLIINNILDEETAQFRIYKINLEIAQLKQKIAQLPPDNLEKIASTFSNAQFWSDLSPSECRFYLREFIKVINIIPVNNKDKTFEITLDFIFATKNQ